MVAAMLASSAIAARPALVRKSVKARARVVPVVAQAESTSRSWAERAAQTAAPLMVALAAAGPVHAANMFDVEAPTSNPSLPGAASSLPKYTRTEGTQVYVKANLSEDSVKLFYMSFGAFMVYGCCYFGAVNDPFYDTEEYRADGGDGTQHWFYKVADNTAEEGREKIYSGLAPNPTDPDYNEYDFVKK